MLGVLAFPRESLKREVGTRPDKSSRHGRVKAVSKCQNICKRAHAHHLHNVLAHLACSSRGFLQPRVQKPRFQREKGEREQCCRCVCMETRERRVSVSSSFKGIAYCNSICSPGTPRRHWSTFLCCPNWAGSCEENMRPVERLNIQFIRICNFYIYLSWIWGSRVDQKIDGKSVHYEEHEGQSRGQTNVGSLWSNFHLCF